MRQLFDRIAMSIAAAVTFCACDAADGRAYAVSDSERNFLSAIVTAVENRDSRWIASHMLLPMVVNARTGRRLVQTEAEMADALALLLTDELGSALKSAAQQALFKNWRGVMAGDGVLWFQEFRRDDGNPIPPNSEPTPHRVEFFRLPAPGKRDPFFGLSRGWYYKAAAAGEIRMIAVRQRNSLRGVRLVVYDSVVAYIHRAAGLALGETGF